MLKYTAWALGAIVILALAAWFWAYQVAMSRYEKQWTVHKTLEVHGAQGGRIRLRLHAASEHEGDADGEVIDSSR